jgi:hypothetical protein
MFILVCYTLQGKSAQLDRYGLVELCQHHGICTAADMEVRPA